MTDESAGRTVRTINYKRSTIYITISDKGYFDFILLKHDVSENNSVIRDWPILKNRYKEFRFEIH